MNNLPLSIYQLVPSTSEGQFGTSASGEPCPIEHLPMVYQVALDKKGDEIEVAFQSLPMVEIMFSLNLVTRNLDNNL